MPRQCCSHPRKAALRVRRTHHARGSKGAQIFLAMIRDEELGRRLRLKPQGAVPRHVLDHEEGAIGDEDHIEETVTNDDVVGAFDDAREDGDARWRRGVRVQDAVGAFLPFLDRGVDRLLDVGAVEVDLGAVGQVVEGARETENVPEQRAGSGDLVDVKTRVHFSCGVKDIVPEVAGATLTSWEVALTGLWTCRWIDKVFGEVVGVAARISTATEIREIGRIKVDKRSPVVNEWYGGD